MPLIDIRNQILSATGTWQDPALATQETPFPFTLADTQRPDRLLLRWAGDSVTLAGPLRIRVTFQTENLTYEMGASSAQQAAQPAFNVAAGSGETVGGIPDQPSGLPINTNVSLLGAATLQASTVYSYTLDIPAGQVWPFVYNARPAAQGMATNFYDRVLIEVAGFDTAVKPIAAGDLPCGLAVRDLPDAASFFPAACEPCDPGAQMKMPPLAPALSVQAASGGCVRTRFFNGMFVTKEDLETEQRYFRVKNRLHNRTIGQGVVWGLNIGKQAEQICVLPGYAIDCCGNDLTVTTVYKVDIAALLRDPAAAEACAKAAGQARRMHLLLEHVECPSEPRPVHSDPCGPTQQLCEPSRIRETVRLRLVPPRDPDTSGPLRDFLVAAENLHKKYGQGLQTDTDLPSTSTVSLSVDATGTKIDVAPGATAKFTGNQVTFAARVSEGVFTGGSLRISKTDGSFSAEEPLALLSLPGAKGLAVALDPGSAYSLTLANWRAESPLSPGWADTGTTTYSIMGVGSDLAVDQIVWQVKGQESPPTTRRVLVRSAACGEPCTPPETIGRKPGPCDPPASKASAVRWPWLHGDPLTEDHAGDPKAVILGIVGAWLQHSVASSVEAEVSEPWSFQRLAATVIYRSAWLLFYGVDAADERQDVGEAMQTLLRGWCWAALYPGPVCAGEPHGVVIGCTTVQDGTIGDVDPFGGRRYVVQYPLLTYWGSQIGLAPLDATVTRLFSLLCCIAALPRPTTSPGAPTFLFKLAEVEEQVVGADGDVAIAGTQAVYIAFGTEQGVRAAWEKETNSSWSVAATHEVSFLLFARYVITALRGELPPSSLPAGQATAAEQAFRIERYTAGGLVEPGVVSLLVTRRSG